MVFRKVKAPWPALRPGRLGSAFGFRFPCLDPRPAAFNSLRSCSFSRCNRSISSSACFKRSRRTSFSCSSSSIRGKGARDSLPAIPNYVNPKSRKCPVKNAYLPLINYNVFISHVHEDDDGLGKLKDLLDRGGLTIRDSSINSSNPNDAQNPDYIK